MKPLFEDHKRKKKKLFPPLMELGNLKEVSYISQIIPETIWIALLIKKHGLQQGTQLSLDLVKTTSEMSDTKSIVSFISSFELLTADEKAVIKKNLLEANVLHKIQDALKNFISIYPFCPLNFLFDVVEEGYDLEEIKDVLEKLFDIKSSEATFMLGSVIYHFGAMGRLHIVKDTALSKLPDLKDYPNTALSQMIASGVRATMYTLMNDTFYNSAGKWHKMFWTRGIELEPCLMNDE